MRYGGNNVTLNCKVAEFGAIKFEKAAALQRRPPQGIAQGAPT
jgi:hypothetical protein